MSALLLARVGLSALFLTMAAGAAERSLGAAGRAVRWPWVGAMLATAAATIALLTGHRLPLDAPAEVAQVVLLTGLESGAPAAGAAGAFPIGLLLWGASTAIALAAGAALWLSQVRRLAGAEPMRLHGQDVLVTDRLGPAVAGLLRARIVVPRWLLELPPSRRRLVLRHEAEHAAAGDHRLVGLAALLCVAMPWNPLLWYQLHRLRLAIELDCDRRVLAREQGARGTYGMLLVDVAERMARGAPLATALAHPRSMLERRIRMMIPTRRRPWSAAGWALGAAALLAIACADTTDPTAATADTPGAAALSPSIDGTQGVLLRRQAAAETAAQLQAATLRPTMREKTQDPSLTRTVDGAGLFRFSAAQGEAVIDGKRAVRFQMRVDENGRAVDFRFQGDMPEELRRRAIETAQGVQYRRPAGATSDTWIHAVAAVE